MGEKTEERPKIEKKNKEKEGRIMNEGKKME